MNHFDSIIKQAFGVVASTFGEIAEWAPSDGSAVQRGKVLFKDPSKAETVGRLASAYSEVDMQPASPFIEYYEGTFAGLRESVSADKQEYITVAGIMYAVQTVPKIWDGKTYRVELQEV